MSAEQEEEQSLARMAGLSGRLAGGAANAVGRRILRIPSVREALRRGKEEASRPDSGEEPASGEELAP